MARQVQQHFGNTMTASRKEGGGSGDAGAPGGKELDSDKYGVTGLDGA